MRFGVLGPLAVWDDEGEQVAVAGTKARALLAVLLVHEGRPVSTDRLIEDLWGARLPGHPANALQAGVSQLRRSVGRDRVLHQPPGYRLRIEAGEMDADRFRELVARARATDSPHARSALLTEALGLWRGPALADFRDEEFARPAVQRWEEHRLTAWEEQAEARLAVGEHPRARSAPDGLAEELSALVAHHPLRERLRAAQLRALYRAGRQSEALASYADLRDRLAEELGLDPGPELMALQQAILNQAPELSGPVRARAAMAAPERPGAHLPTPLTELVGREAAVREVAGLLGGARLVTLTGPGGVGKTRLAVAAAERLADAFPDGVRHVELGGHRGASADLAEVVAAVLGIRDDGAWGMPAPAPPAEGSPAARPRLTAALRDRRLLLVLDNCEHLVEPVAALVEPLLHGAPGLRVLATSQEPLGLAGETVRPVEPLPPADAVRLFAARAAATAPRFVLDDATRPDVEEICRRLDGIPLALELAATRVRALGVRQLAARLGDRFRVLTAGRRGAPARQQTLRAVLDWSWELLTTPERIVLCRLAVHTDGCTLEAAEAVCAGGEVAAEEVLDLLARLVDRSLVVMAEGAAGPRYRLLESVAAYATERLHEMADAPLVRRRHRDHHTELAERARPCLKGPEQRHWLRCLDAETGNLRAALDGAVARGEAAAALRLCTALSWYWLLRGRLGEARRSLAAALSCPDPAATDHPGTADADAPQPPARRGPRAEARALYAGFALLTGDRAAPPTPDLYREIEDPGSRAATRWFHAYALFNVGDLAASERLTEQALAGSRAADDRWGVAAALGLRAVHHLIRGDLTALRHDSEHSTRLFAELGDAWGRLRSGAPLTALAEIQGDYERAAALLHDGLRLAEELGLPAEVSARLSGLGRIALLTGDWDRARTLHHRARRLAAEQGFTFGGIHAEIGLALGARRQGDLDEAEALLHRVRDWYRSASSESGNSLVLAELGFVAEQRGDAPAARTHHLEGLAIARQVGDPRALALALEGLAGAEALAGRPEHSALLLGSAAAARDAAGAPLPAAERGDIDRITAAATGPLGVAAFAAAFERGTALSGQEALAACALPVAAVPGPV
ncbi:hypothetical protein ACZ90_68420 [Streptomyces albus subsp. albus]|nr:hypothetical protein ACZ90_68420 [Streptomyces albus subsp. albus]